MTDKEYEDFKSVAIERVLSAYQFSQSLGIGKLYVAFSGGKDSVAIYGICKLASERLGMGVLDMCEFNYNVTTVDPPELVTFIREQFPFVHRNRPDITMWGLIIKKKLPPTRLMRYCCSELKERGGKGRFCITGVRWAESSQRKNTRGKVENVTREKSKRIFFEDKEEDRRQLEHCIPKQKYVCNPIIDWTDDMVWEFIRREELPYCKLYDEGFTRIGCIGCPNVYKKHRIKEFERWPKYKEQYIRTFERMLENRRKSGLPTEWKNGEEVMNWWINGGKKKNG